MVFLRCIFYNVNTPLRVLVGWRDLIFYNNVSPLFPLCSPHITLYCLWCFVFLFCTLYINPKFMLQMKLYNSSFPASEHVLYMGWVCEGVLNHNLPWQNWKPKFIALKGTDIYMFDTPPVSCNKAGTWSHLSLIFDFFFFYFKNYCRIYDLENMMLRKIFSINYISRPCWKYKMLHSSPLSARVAELVIGSAEGLFFFLLS